MPKGTGPLQPATGQAARALRRITIALMLATDLERMAEKIANHVLQLARSSPLSDAAAPHN